MLLEEEIGDEVVGEWDSRESLSMDSVGGGAIGETTSVMMRREGGIVEMR